jgi:hypothetical protein
VCYYEVGIAFALLRECKQLKRSKGDEDDWVPGIHSTTKHKNPNLPNDYNRHAYRLFLGTRAEENE